MPSGRPQKVFPNKRVNKQYDSRNLENALEACKSGRMTQKDAASYFKVPKSTLNRHFKTPNLKSVGGQLGVDAGVEKMLVETLEEMAIWNHPIDKEHIKDLVKNILDRQNIVHPRFKDNRPGKDWYYGFRERNTLSERLASNICRGRAALNKQAIVPFYRAMAVSFKRLFDDVTNLPAAQIFNFDETNLTNDPGKKKVVVPRGCGRVEVLQDHSKTSVSLMFCGSATGFFIPPMVVYKAGNLYKGWTTDGISGAVYATTPSGWFNKELFFKWFRDCFLPQTRHIPGPKVLLGDNVSLHMNDDVFRLAKENNCFFIFFPANGTHLFQPLDVGVFRPLKAQWHSTVKEFLKSTRRQNIPKEQFPNMVKELLSEYQTSEQNLISSFRACGIVPFCPEKALEMLPENKKRKRRATPVELDQSQAQIDTHTALINALKDANQAGSKKKRGPKITSGVIVTPSDSSSEPSTSAGPVPIAVLTSVPLEEGEEGDEEEEEEEDIPDDWLCVLCHMYYPIELEGDCDWTGCVKCSSWYHNCCLKKVIRLIDGMDYVCPACQ